MNAVGTGALDAFTRAALVGRRLEGDLTGHHVWASRQRSGSTIIHYDSQAKLFPTP